MLSLADAQQQIQNDKAGPTDRPAAACRPGGACERSGCEDFSTPGVLDCCLTPPPCASGAPPQATMVQLEALLANTQQEAHNAKAGFSYSYYYY